MWPFKKKEQGKPKSSLMDEEKAKSILSYEIQSDDSLYNLGNYLAWPRSCGNKDIACLDGIFTADELEAISWWMRNKTTLEENNDE